MVRVGVIGLGYWGPNLVRNLHSIQGVELSLLCDKKKDRIEYLKSFYPALNYTENCEDIFTNRDIDAVVIATPLATHFRLASEALRSGKDVFVEKPLTQNVEEAEELARIVEDTGRILMVGHTFEYNPAVRKIKQLISSGEIGEVKYITSTRINLGLYRRDADVIWDLACHDFSIILYWLNEEPLHINAIGRDSILRGTPDIAFIQVIFPSGVLSNIQVSWLAPGKIRSTIIVGSEKMIIYNDMNVYEKVKVFDSGVEVKSSRDYGELQLSYRNGDVHCPKIDNVEPLRVEMEHFIDCVKERKKPFTDVHRGLMVVRTLERAAHSLRFNGNLTSWNVPALAKGHR